VAAVYLPRRKPAIGDEFPTTAEIFGIRWRWTNQEGEMRDVVPYCPRCDVPAVPVVETRHGFLHLVSYKCECRKWRSKSFQCSQEKFIERVCRTIQQDARKGRLKQAGTPVLAGGK
jgi:hypothetical protein